MIAADDDAAWMTTSGHTLSLHGEFDLATRDRLAEVAETFAERRITEQRDRPVLSVHSMPDAVVDAGDVRFVDATCIGVLVTLHTRLAEAGIRLRTRRPTTVVRRVSAICALDGVLGLDPPSVQAADRSAVATAADPAGPTGGQPLASVPERQPIVPAPRAARS